MSIDTLIKLSRSMHLPMEYILFGDGYQPGDASAAGDRTMESWKNHSGSSDETAGYE